MRVEVVLVYRLTEQGEGAPWINVVLLFLTLLTTLGSGAMLRGIDPFDTAFFPIGSTRLPYPTGIDVHALLRGGVFAVPFLGVLLVHEMAHYVAARWNGVRASLPYFIPFPPYYSVIGSLGAFIRLKSPSVRRSVLFDIGASGPFGSFLVSIPMLWYGLSRSRLVPGGNPEGTPFFVMFFDQPVWLGSSVITWALSLANGLDPMGDGAILLHPIALAGWLGLFVTALNLLPLGQLDGGHVLFASVLEKQERLARLFMVVLIALGFWWWGWWAWAALVLFLHRGAVGHPPLLQPATDLDRVRRVLTWVLFVIFWTTLVPVPIRL